MSLKKRTTKKSQSRSKSSQKWLKDHFDDVYVKQAQKAGYRSRAVYKLLEIQEKDHILKHGMTVVDLGAAPGGWSQVASKIVGSSGKVIALDILPIDSLAHVEFIQGDFMEPSVLEKLLEVLDGQEVSLVMDLAQNVLCKNGNFLVKVFQGSGFDSYYKTLQSLFSKVTTRKPKASKSNSREVYLLARGFLK